MKPKKSKELINDVAREVALPARVIEDIVNFYWKDVWDNLTSLSAPKVHVTNFGDFNVKHWLLDREIAKCEAYDKSTKHTGKQKAAVSFGIENKLVLLKKIKEEVQEEQQRKEFIYEHKRLKNGVDNEISESLDQQVEDIRGNQELVVQDSGSRGDRPEETGHL